MNQLELVNQDYNITVSTGNILFPAYNVLLLQANDIAMQLEETEVSEENLKESKKLLATVNKSVKVLEDRRIEIKKEMLQPYVIFEEQVKEIVKVIKDANETVKEQVKGYEELERCEKEDTLKVLFKQRIEAYSFGDVFTFDDFIKPQHLNKTVSLTRVEEMMVTWLESVEKDFNVINMLPNKIEILAEYVKSKDLTTALMNVSTRSEKIKTLEKVTGKINKPEEFFFKVFDEKDIFLIEMYCKEINIKFERMV